MWEGKHEDQGNRAVQIDTISGRALRMFIGDSKYSALRPLPLTQVVNPPSNLKLALHKEKVI